MEIQVTLEGKTAVITREKYVSHKQKALKEFGYDNLTLEEVDLQLDAVLEGKEFGAGLDIIGMFIQKDYPKRV